jgi:hypothetical protein
VARSENSADVLLSIENLHVNFVTARGERVQRILPIIWFGSQVAISGTKHRITIASIMHRT